MTRDAMELRFLGVSGFEIVAEDGTRVVIDPLLDGLPDSGLPASAVTMDELSETDVVAVTHGARDHLGQAVEIALTHGSTLLAGPEVRRHALQRGVPEEQLVKAITGTVCTHGGVRIRTLPACHLSMLVVGDTVISAAPLSFLVETDSGTRVYHSGDTSLFGDLRMIGELYRPHVALLCVGATEANLTPLPPAEALLAADWLGVSVVVPMHFRPGDSEPREFATLAAERRPDLDVRCLAPGDRTLVGPFADGPT